MDSQDITIEDIPHGHGKSFKQGISDGILNQDVFKDDLPDGHNLSYKRGKTLGKIIRSFIAKKVKK